MGEIIQSTTNPQVKAWAKLLTSKGRKASGRYIVEGFHLVEEALRAGVEVDKLLMTEEVWQSWPTAEDLPLQLISPEVAHKLSATPSNQGIFAILFQKAPQEANLSGRRYLLLDRVQDPGNAGTMVRTAHAAGWDGVVLGQGTVDPYNDKFIRSCQGSNWHLELIQDDLGEVIERLRSRDLPVYAAALDDQAQSFRLLAQQDQGAILVGNEGQGLAADLLALADQTLYIPMPGQAESLNVAVAAGLMMYEMGRDL